MATAPVKGHYPMFIVTSGRVSDVTCGESQQAGKTVTVQRSGSGGTLKQQSSSEEFVFL